MSNLSWKQIVIAVLGIGAVIVGVLFPPIAAILTPIGTGLLGLAVPAPGKSS